MTSLWARDFQTQKNKNKNGNLDKIDIHNSISAGGREALQSKNPVEVVEIHLSFPGQFPSNEK